MDTLHKKQERLSLYLKKLDNVAIAFSGGVDSTFLLKMAKDSVDGSLLAITARSLNFPKREFDEASAFTAKNGIEHIIIDSNELDIDGFSENPPNRCYLCKMELFSKFKSVAKERGITHVAEASNIDDDSDYRPGLLAVSELGIKSPLREIGFTKSEIRLLSKEMGLATWNKQSFACLSSRFPYGERITPERLRMIDESEQFLIDLGFVQVRVRFHGNLARIETDEAGFAKLSNKSIRDMIYDRFREIGFVYIAIDIKGYRVGSMNETLNLLNFR